MFLPFPFTVTSGSEDERGTRGEDTVLALATDAPMAAATAKLFMMNS